MIFEKTTSRKQFGEDVEGPFLLEKECLPLLNKNFKCICSKPRIHFPKIIEYNEEEFKFTLTHCGTDLGYFLRRKSLSRGASKQVKCIIYNLKINKIIHRDIAFRNLCINKNGDLSLIDFDVASIGECWEYEEFEKIMVGELEALGRELAK